VNAWFNQSSRPLASASVVARIAVLIVVLLASSSAGAQTSTSSFEAQLAEGTGLLGTGHPLEAVRILNAAKQSAPLDPRPYFYSGMALEQAGRLRDAASELGEAVHLAPHEPVYRVFQAHVLEQLKQDPAAQDSLAVFQRQQTLEQLDPAWLRLLADVYYRLQKADDAIRVLDLCAKHDPNDARIDLYRGQAYVLKGQPDAALAAFQRSIEKSSQNPQAYFESGKILYEENLLPAARSALVNAVQQDERNPAYLSKLASVCLALDDTQAAISYLKRADATGSMLPEVYYVLARAYDKAGDPSLGATYMREFQHATSDKRDHDAQVLEAERPIAQGQRELEKGNTVAARALFEKALDVDPDQWEPNAYLAEMDLSSGDLQQAYPHLERLERLDPDSTVGNFLIARYWFKRKEYDRARAYAEKVKLSRPGNSELRALLGDIYLELGKKQNALLEYQEAARLDPSRADLRERLQKINGSANDRSVAQQ
jgi:tetratricopeptide (TPR) repeat protein